MIIIGLHPITGLPVHAPNPCNNLLTPCCLLFLQLREPGLAFRAMVILAQGLFFNTFFLAYLVSPKTCHAAVGYLEEEAVK